MKLGLILAFLSAAVGFVAAIQKFKASRVDYRPFEERDGQPVEVPEWDVRAWLQALRNHTVNKSGRLNKSADASHGTRLFRSDIIWIADRLKCEIDLLSLVQLAVKLLCAFQIK